MWTKHHQIPGPLCVGLRPHTAGSELLEPRPYWSATSSTWSWIAIT
jgi:hypothetical protein